MVKDREIAVPNVLFMLPFRSNYLKNLLALFGANTPSYCNPLPMDFQGRKKEEKGAIEASWIQTDAPLVIEGLDLQCGVGESSGCAAAVGDRRPSDRSADGELPVATCGRRSRHPARRGASMPREEQSDVLGRGFGHRWFRIASRGKGPRRKLHFFRLLRIRPAIRRRRSE